MSNERITNKRLTQIEHNLQGSHFKAMGPLWADDLLKAVKAERRHCRNLEEQIEELEQQL